ncbi:GGDEF domain-containing protein [Chitiniphilus eburneus]|uniref:diguanylate cyclase n=1 Tax=Chitiniphilus eburneus TaxID=2571148 RepID=A0A4U0PT95_9NEIS|nr:GGDEF domain-containing protein [Chitiniphilus eburneus]TJZ70732.1 GGDEF domain-containing protein [Chitiniphilus eburneus]
MNPFRLPDTGALLMLSMLLHATLAGMMLLIWRTRRVFAGFGIWVVADLAAAVGLFLVLLAQTGWAGRLPVLLAMPLILAAPLCVEWGLRSALGYQPRRALPAMAIHYVLAYLGWLVVVLGELGAGWRVFAFSMALASLCLRVISLLLTDRQARRNVALGMIAYAHLLFCVLNVVHGVNAVLTLAPDASPIRDDPWFPFVILATVLAMLARDMSFLVFTHEQVEGELRRSQVELERLANEDVLTGLPNRRYFEATFPRLQALALRAAQPQTLLVFDVDDFKAVNDSQGHLGGDRVLCAVAQAVRDTLREGDLATRLGGDEFALLLHDCSEAGAEIVAERLKQHIALHTGMLEMPVTVSIGHTAVAPSEVLTAAYQRADEASYVSKRSRP